MAKTKRFVVAGEDRSEPASGKPVPIAWVQNAMDMLERDGEVVIDVETVGYRSAFIGAVLATVPQTRTALAPPRVIRVTARS